MKLIKKLFIKNYTDTENPTVRYAYGIVAGIFGIITNIILFIAKIVIGLIGHSITIVADAVNNLSDAGSSIITVFGFKMSSRPADNDHPYGHARYEYVAGLIIALIVFAIGIILGKSSIEKIISPTATTITIYTYIILSASIILKTFQLLMYYDFSKAISSNALKASAQDSRNDIISTAVVLIASILIDIFNPEKISIDGIFGVIVSLFIIVSGIGLIKDTISPLLGEKPDEELVAKIKEKVLSHDGILGIHDLMIHSYGAGNMFVSLHAEVSADADIFDSHEIIDKIERELSTELNLHACIHMDPIQNSNEQVLMHKKHIEEMLVKYNDKLTMHDFRMVFGKKRTNIIFDVEEPFDINISATELTEYFTKEYAKINKNMQYFFIISIDKICTY